MCAKSSLKQGDVGKQGCGWMNHTWVTVLLLLSETPTKLLSY